MPYHSHYPSFLGVPTELKVISLPFHSLEISVTGFPFMVNIKRSFKSLNIYSMIMEPVVLMLKIPGLILEVNCKLLYIYKDHWSFLQLWEFPLLPSGFATGVCGIFGSYRGARPFECRLLPPSSYTIHMRSRFRRSRAWILGLENSMCCCTWRKTTTKFFGFPWVTWQEPSRTHRCMTTTLDNFEI